MQLKRIRLLFLVALLAFLPLIAIETNATTYSVDISQSPRYPQKDGIVTITVEVIDSLLNEEYNAASLNYWLDGVKYVCDPEPLLSSIQTIETLTFTIGPFDKNDFVEYYILLEFVYADNYQSEWYSFTVGDKSPRPPLTQMQIIYIVCGVVVGFALIAVVIVMINRRR